MSGMADSQSKRQAWKFVPTERDHGGYIACLVTEGQPGYQVARGSGRLAQPWYLSTDTTTQEGYRRAEAAVDEWNLRDFELTPEQAKEICDSSMIAQIRGGN